MSRKKTWFSLQFRLCKSGVNMRIGKLNSELLEKNVYPYLGVKRDEVIVHSGFGEDSAVLKTGEGVQVLSTDPITGADEGIGRLAVHIACNDIAACAAEPVGILVTVMFPESIDEDSVKALMEEINDTARDIGVEVVGGHTEVTPAVNKTVVSTTAIGKAPADGYVTSSGAQEGDSVIMTKTAGLEGTSIIATEYYGSLEGVLSKQEIDFAREMVNKISVIEEGLAAGRCGATAMHDVTEGGILTAAYELAMASDKGITLYKDDIPVADVTKKICRHLDLDPLGLLSSGTILITTPNPKQVLDVLSDKGVQATVIGRINKGEHKIVEDGDKYELKPHMRDELYRLIEKK